MSALGLPSVMESGSALTLRLASGSGWMLGSGSELEPASVLGSAYSLVLRSVSASGSGLELQSESGSASVWRSASVKALA
jgi:hypothetical protein